MTFIENFEPHFSQHSLRRSESVNNSMGERKISSGAEEFVQGIIVTASKPRETGADIIRESSDYVFYSKTDVTSKAQDLIERGAEVFEVMSMQKKYDFGELSYHAHYLKLII